MQRGKKILTWLLLGIVGLAAFTWASIEFTSRSEFCNTCHYMEPFYLAWKNSSHSNVDCIVCHYPPGILSTFEGKVKGLEQLFKYATQSYRRSKPWAEIPDASCLREGCHETRLLEGKVKFKEEITFDHKPHLTELRRGKKLRCTSCHSQIVQGEHITVTSSTCFLCHFKGLDSEAQPSCTHCHEAPVQTPERSVSYDHTQVVERNIDCHKCHGKMVVGDGAVPMENCEDCHFQRDRLAYYNDTDFIHNKHITEHKVECERCHLRIQHKSVSRSHDVKPDCHSCHPDYHQAQEMLFLGTGGRDVADTPNPMFASGLNCQACHVFHQNLGSFQPAGETFTAGAASCEPCHGAGYGGLLAAWSDSTQKRLNLVGRDIRQVEKELARVDSTTESGKKALEVLENARFNYQLVEYGKSVHNITYSDKLLLAARQDLQKALDGAGSKYRLAAYPWSNQVVPSECANCHSRIEETRVEVFEGLQFDHGRHIAQDSLTCRNCHSNMRRHGEMVMPRETCIACHHREENIGGVNCAPCHRTQESIYAGTALEAGLPDMMSAGGVECSGCHLDQQGQVARPTGKNCATCHDESYAAMLEEWQKSTGELMAQLGALLERARAAGLTAQSNSAMSRAVQIQKLFNTDGSRGAHNYQLADQLLGTAVEGLRLALPAG